MYYRETSVFKPNKWVRIKTSEFYRQRLYLNKFIEVKNESSSPKQIAQREKFILKGQILSIASQLSSLIYIKSNKEKLKMSEEEKLKLVETITIISQVAKKL